MSKISLAGNASGTGTFTIASPNSNTDRVLNLPDSNGTILTTATAGVPVNGPAFSAYQTGTPQSISNNTTTKLTLNAEEFDTNACFDPTTNYRFTPTVAGYYLISVGVGFSGTNVAGVVYVSLYKNGAQTKVGVGPYVSSTGTGGGGVSATVFLNGSTDYVEAYVTQVTGAAQPILQSATYFQAFLARSAT